MRKLNYVIAASLDGLVARRDGSFEDFLMEGPHVTDFLETVAAHDTVLMGRHTYEVGLKYKITNPYPTLKTYVFSRTLLESPDPAVTVVSTNAAEHVRELKRQPGKDIWLCGAGSLAASLLAENLVDGVTVKVNPILLGSGIPLVFQLERTSRLKLIASKPFDNGVVTLSYRVEQAQGA